MGAVVLMCLSPYMHPESTGLPLLGTFTSYKANVMNSPTAASSNASVYVGCLPNRFFLFLVGFSF